MPTDIPTESWVCFEGGLRLADSLISFQRFPRPVGPLSPESVQSYGALRPQRTAQGVLLPLPKDEAFWIGATFSGKRLGVLVLHAVLTSGRRLELSGAWSASLFSVVGFAHHGELHALARPDVKSIDIKLGPAAVSVRIVAPNVFTRLTGSEGPAPLNARTIYKGWLLP